jgi:hypothetical protein
LGVQAWLFTQSDEWAERARLHDVRVVRRLVYSSHTHTHTHSLSLSLSLSQVTSGVRCDVLLNVMTTFIDETKDERKVRAQMAVLVAYQVCP